MAVSEIGNEFGTESTYKRSVSSIPAGEFAFERIMHIGQYFMPLDQYLLAVYL